MKSISSHLVKTSDKSPAGLIGFSEITGGGLPRGRITLLLEQPRQRPRYPIVETQHPIEA